VLCGGFSGVGSRVALVHEGQLDRVAGQLLDLGSERGHLFAVPLIGGCNGQRQQVAQGIDRDVDLASLAPLGPIVAGSSAALGRRLQCTAVQTDRRGLAF